MDSSSTEINRRKRRANTESLDVEMPLNMLMRHDSGELKLRSIVRVPSAEEEDRRQLHREVRSAKKGNLFIDLMKGKAKEVNVTVLRSAAPASALITGRIPSLEDLAAYISHEDEDSSFVCKAISLEHTRGYLCEITRKPSKEKAQAEKTPTEPAKSRADSFEEIRFSLSEGTFTKAEGFMVAHNKRSALLDLDRLMNLWNSKAPKITIALEWQVE